MKSIGINNNNMHVITNSVGANNSVSVDRHVDYKNTLSVNNISFRLYNNRARGARLRHVSVSVSTKGHRLPVDPCTIAKRENRL